MGPLLKFLARRVFFALLTIILVSIVMYFVVYLSPVEVRVDLFMPKNFGPQMTEEQIARLRDRITEKNHLNDAFIVQYWYWGKNFIENQWGYSPSLQQYVLPAILARSPATFELTICSMLLIIPLSLFSGMYAAHKKDKPSDLLVRLLSTTTAYIPLFVLAYILLALFYVNFKWATLSSLDISGLVTKEGFHPYTGMSILDGLLNGRLDIALTALRRLALPILTIAATQWAYLSRLIRNVTIEELQKDYVLAAKARGASRYQIFTKQILKNTSSVFFSNTAMSAAGIVTGVFVVERIFIIPGVSDILFRKSSYVPDAIAVVGFAFYSVLIVLILMLILDVINAAFNPLISRDVTGGSDVE
jgi:ABC-type dipeptide/oligopeptide/nickel transport system permease component